MAVRVAASDRVQSPTRIPSLSEPSPQQRPSSPGASLGSSPGISPSSTPSLAHCSIRSTWQFLLLASIVFAGATWLWSNLAGPVTNEPPAHWNVDGVFYDNIAFHLKDGSGFTVDFEQPQWRAVYQDANQQTAPAEFYKWVLDFEGQGSTTMRSPGYPFVLSWVYRIFGWRFDCGRYLSVLSISLALTIVTTWCFRRWGTLLASVAAALMLLDYSIMRTTVQISSESLATLAFVSTFVCVAALLDRPNLCKALATGMTFAALFLTRGNWNLGLLLVLLLGITVRLPAIARRIKPVEAKHVWVAIAVSLCLGMPWWVRNCRATKQIQPFGTAGAAGMVAAYCDESLANFGNWKAAVFHRNQWEVFNSMDWRNTTLPQRESAVAKASVSKSLVWAQRNWYRLPELAIYRYISHWGLTNQTIPVPLQVINLVWVVCGLTGCLFLSGRYRNLFWFVLTLDALIVMLTWAHLGRYGIPVRPIIHIGCAIFVVRFWRYVLFERRKAG